MRTLGVGEAVTVLQSLHAIDLLGRMKSVSVSARSDGRGGRREGIHNQSLGIFHSRSKSSGGPHPPWIWGWGRKVKGG
jgi:hypothetical protein